MAGIDPGTVSFDLCVLQDGEPVVQDVFQSAELGEDPAPLLHALAAHGPYDLVYGPSGYGLPLVAAADVGELQLSEMVLVRPDHRHVDAGVGGLRSLLRALAGSGHPVVFGPGAIHLQSIPAHRKRNRIDLGTADKVCAVACAVSDSAGRRGVPPSEVSLILLELGGAFTAALAVDRGRIVDGLGGSGGPPGARAAGALDGELAYLLGPALTKATLFSGGAFDPAWSEPDRSEGWTVLLEGAAKAVRALSAILPHPYEIVVSGRQARADGLIAMLGDSLSDLAPVRGLLPGRASAAAFGGALLADGLAGGRHEPLVRALALRECGGTALDHLRVAGAEAIALG